MRINGVEFPEIEGVVIHPVERRTAVRLAPFSAKASFTLSPESATALMNLIASLLSARPKWGQPGRNRRRKARLAARAADRRQVMQGALQERFGRGAIKPSDAR